MALPNIMRRLFRNDGYGPLLKSEIIPFASDLASKAADVVASTEWVRDLAVSPIYVDPNGLDTNDGFTSQTPVKTFSKALEIGSSLPSQDIKLVVAGGSYTDSVFIESKTVSITLLGDVNLVGSFAVVSCSTVYIVGNFVFSISGIVTASDNAQYVPLNITDSIFLTQAEISVTILSGTGPHAIGVNRSKCLFDAGISVSVNDSATITSTLFPIYHGSVVVTNKKLNLANKNSGNNIPGLTVSYNSSYFSEYAPAISVTGKINVGLNIRENSQLDINNGTINIPSATGSALSVSINSAAYFSNCTGVMKGGSIPLYIHANSGCVFDSASGNTLEFGTVGTASVVFTAGDFAHISLFGQGTYRFTGSTSIATMFLYGNSEIKIGTSSTLNGSITGTRYGVQSGSQLVTDGAGANRIPGTAAGWASANTFSSYN